MSPYSNSSSVGKSVFPREISSQTIPESKQNDRSSPLHTKIKEIINQPKPELKNVKTKLSAQIISEIISKKELVDNKNHGEENNNDQINSNLEQITQNFQDLKQKAEKSSSTETVVIIVQWWVADFVLKGGSVAASSGVPFLLSTSPDSLPMLDPVTEGIKMATNLLDIGTGLIGFIYKTKFIREAEYELFKLKSNSHILKSDQLTRLEQLEKIIKYEKSLLNSQGFEQHIRLIRNAFSCVTFVFSWLETCRLFTSITVGCETLIGGFNAVLYGIYFYRAHKNLHAHRKWSKDFKVWIKKQTSFIDLTSFPDSKAGQFIQASTQQIDEKIAALKATQLKQIQRLQDKIAKKEITIESIQVRVKDIKRSSLQNFVENLKIQKGMSLEKFQTRLNEKLGTPLNPNFVSSLHIAYLKLEELNASSKPLSQDKQIEIENTKKLISKLLDEYCEEWIQAQTEETLLATYVDYQSVLDPTIKNSLIGMVRKKHQIEKNFLKVKRVDLGVRFSVATIIFGAALTLVIIGFAATPVGAAGLILAALTLGSITISFALLSGGYYCAYREKPALTAATLKGAYLRLYAYYALAQIDSVEESIEHLLKSTWQKKQNQLANVINRLPLIHRLFPRKEKKSEEISALPITIEMDFQESLSKFKHWKAKAVALENELEELTWRDFAKQADLQVAYKSANPSSAGQDFDTLEALNDALSHVDFDLMSSNTKELLEIQLGINVQSMQKEIEEDPLIVKKLLINFFNLDDIAFVKLIGEQSFIKPETR